VKDAPFVGHFVSAGEQIQENQTLSKVRQYQERGEELPKELEKKFRAQQRERIEKRIHGRHSDFQVTLAKVAGGAAKYATEFMAASALTTGLAAGQGASIGVKVARGGTRLLAMAHNPQFIGQTFDTAANMRKPRLTYEQGDVKVKPNRHSTLKAAAAAELYTISEVFSERMGEVFAQGMGSAYDVLPDGAKNVVTKHLMRGGISRGRLAGIAAHASIQGPFIESGEEVAAGVMQGLVNWGMDMGPEKKGLFDHVATRTPSMKELRAIALTFAAPGAVRFMGMQMADKAKARNKLKELLKDEQNAVRFANANEMGAARLAEADEAELGDAVREYFGTDFGMEQGELREVQSATRSAMDDIDAARGEPQPHEARMQDIMASFGDVENRSQASMLDVLAEDMGIWEKLRIGPGAMRSEESLEEALEETREKGVKYE